MKKEEVNKNEQFYTEIRQIIETSRTNAIRSVDFSRVQMYWLLGKRIFEEEQQGLPYPQFSRRTNPFIWQWFFGKTVRAKSPILSDVSNCERTAFAIELDTVQTAHSDRRPL